MPSGVCRSDMRRLLMMIKPKIRANEPDNHYRKLFYWLVTNAKFDVVIMIAILLNTLTMMLEFYSQPDTYAPDSLSAPCIRLLHCLFPLDAVFCLVMTPCVVLCYASWYVVL